MNLELQIPLGSLKEVPLALILWKQQMKWIINQWLCSRKRMDPWSTSEMWMRPSLTGEACSITNRWSFLKGTICMGSSSSMRWSCLRVRERKLPGLVLRKKRRVRIKRPRRVSRQTSRWVDSMGSIIQERGKSCLTTNIIWLLHLT